MPRTGTENLPPSSEEDEPPAPEYSDEEPETTQDQPDPKRAQRLAALQKAQASRMAKAELKRKEKAVADYESTQRKEEISRKFDELQERLGKKPKAPTPPTPKANDEASSDEEPLEVKPKQKRAAPTSKKAAPKKPKKKVVVQEEPSSSESEEEVVVKRKKKRSKPTRRVVYESETDSEDEYINHVRSRAAAYYKLMF